MYLCKEKLDVYKTWRCSFLGSIWGLYYSPPQMWILIIVWLLEKFAVFKVCKSAN